MKFGKLSNVDQVDFNIPSLEFINKNTTPSSGLNLYLGTTSWSNKEWNGTFYPKGTNSSTFLSEYAKLFNTIELNSTHYHIPSEERVKNWKSKVSDGFLFCPKVPQIISHRSNLSSETSQTKTFFKAISEFGDHLGPCFMQLPEYFSPKELDSLLHFLNRKPQVIKFAIELRHKDWFSNETHHLRLLAKELASLNTALVVTDVAGRRDVCHGILPNSTLMLRLVGNGQHPTDQHRMDAWIKQINAHQTQLKDIYMFFHQPSMEDIPQMVNYFIENLEKLGQKSPISELKPKFQPNIQLRLF